ncbi:MAG: DNA-damage-inducible protein D [Lentimonas sp.]|jgi:DNA-damage-inducible protein D
MDAELIHGLTGTFEDHAQKTDSGVEFWLGRNLQHLLGYSEWRNFQLVVNQAKSACEVSDYAVDNHFVGVNKMIELAKGATRAVDDIMLTRYACYLVGQNGDPREQEIAFARTHTMRSEPQTSNEQVTNNKAVRNTLIERRFASEQKKSLRNPEALEE